MHIVFLACHNESVPILTADMTDRPTCISRLIKECINEDINPIIGVPQTVLCAMWNSQGISICTYIVIRGDWIPVDSSTHVPGIVSERESTHLLEEVNSECLIFKLVTYYTVKSQIS